MQELVIVGAGPCGLSTAIEAKRKGIAYVVIDKGGVVDAIRRFPTDMTFLSTTDVVEIGGVPFVSQGDKPTRKEALKYFRKVVMTEALNVRLYTKMVGLKKEADHFVLTLQTRNGTEQMIAKRVVLAMGYYDAAKKLGVPGEDLPWVSHYYSEAHPYFRQNVLVVGAGNSAVEAALDLYRQGAYVTMMHRGPWVSSGVKPWVLPDIENRLKKEEIAAIFNATLQEIRDGEVRYRIGSEEKRLATDFVLLLTGFEVDYNILNELGVTILSDGTPYVTEHYETNVANLYLAGVMVAGRNGNKIFIENGRFHGPKIVESLE